MDKGDKNKNKKKIALVLSGGGARGAYEVGVLKYLFENFPNANFDIYCGTSVGAIHTVAISSMKGIENDAIRMLESIWKNMNMNEVLEFGPLKARDIFLWVLGKGKEFRRSLFNTSVIRKYVQSKIQWQRLHQLTQSEEISSVAIAATHIGSGIVTIFIESKNKNIEWRDPFCRPENTLLSFKHILASASVHFIFPSVKINTEYYCDGGLRINTPLSPAIRLGTDKIFVIPLRMRYTSEEREKIFQDKKINNYPSPFLLFGKIMNALAVDRIIYDIDRVEIMNRFISQSEIVCGQNFLERLNKEMRKIRGYEYRKIETLCIYPSRDIGMLALLYASEITKKKKYPKIYSLLIKTMLPFGIEGQSDLLSYLLFDSEFTSELINLGYNDAKEKKEEISKFFDFK